MSCRSHVIILSTLVCLFAWAYAQCSWTAPDGMNFDLLPVQRTYVIRGGDAKYFVNPCGEPDPGFVDCIEESCEGPDLTFPVFGIWTDGCAPMGMLANYNYSYINPYLAYQGIQINFPPNCQELPTPVPVRFVLPCLQGERSFDIAKVSGSNGLVITFTPSMYGCPVESTSSYTITNNADVPLGVGSFQTVSTQSYLYDLQLLYPTQSGTVYITPSVNVTAIGQRSTSMVTVDWNSASISLQSNPLQLTLNATFGYPLKPGHITIRQNPRLPTAVNITLSKLGNTLFQTIFTPGFELNLPKPDNSWTIFIANSNALPSVGDLLYVPLLNHKTPILAGQHATVTGNSSIGYQITVV